MKLSEAEFGFDGMLDRLRLISKAVDDSKTPFVPAYYGHQPKVIRFLDKPITQGGTVREVPIEEFCAKEGITWSETPYIHESLKQRWLDPERGAGRGSAQHYIAQKLFAGTDRLAITQMDERVGKGLVALTSFKQGEYICCYTGTLTTKTAINEAAFQAYGYECNHPALNKTWFAQDLGSAMYNAEHYRNYSSYMQHAPLESNPSFLAIPESYRAWVQTCNVAVAPSVHIAFPVLVMFARRDIAAGEYLSFDFGEFWRGQKTMGYGDGSYCVFDYYGRVMGTVNVENQFTVEPGYDVAGVPKVDQRADDEQLLKILDTVGREESDIQVVAVNCMKSLFSVLERNPIFLQPCYVQLLKKYHEISKERELLKFYNQFVEFVEGELFMPKELYYHKMEIRLYLSHLLRGYQKLCEQRKDFSLEAQVKGAAKKPTVNLTQNELVELQTRLGQKTNFKWAINFSQQIAFLASEDEQQLKKVRFDLQKQQIFSKSLARRQGGKWYLVYETAELNLNSVNRIEMK